MSISQLVSFFISKTILTYTGSELENKRINCEKTSFRAIATRGHDVTKMSRDTRVRHRTGCAIYLLYNVQRNQMIYRRKKLLY